MTPGLSAELARRLAPDRVSVGREREITVDRSNDCVVVDEAVFVKWLTPPTPRPHRGAELLAHLQTVEFEHIPELYGVVYEDQSVVALVLEHIAGARDGWEWFFEEVLAVADGTGREHDARRSAERMGTLVAELHVALSTPSDARPHAAAPVSGTVERDRCRALLASALDELRAGDCTDAYAVLAACQEEISELIDAMPRDRTVAIPIHGDLHLGQVLRAGERLVFIDFEGNPLTPTVHRPPCRPPAVDVASFIQSIDHGVRMAQYRWPGRDAMFDALAARLAGDALTSYRQRVAELSMPDLLDERMLPGLRAAQELHELVYAVRRLPRWIYAPTLALRGMFRSAAGA
jgi:maltokinase